MRFTWPWTRREQRHLELLKAEIREQREREAAAARVVGLAAAYHWRGPSRAAYLERLR